MCFCEKITLLFAFRTIWTVFLLKFIHIYVSIAKSIAWCNDLLLGKSRTILQQLTQSIPMGQKSGRVGLSPDFEIIVPYPLSLTYGMKDSGLTQSILLNTPQLILGTGFLQQNNRYKTEQNLVGQRLIFQRIPLKSEVERLALNKLADIPRVDLPHRSWRGGLSQWRAVQQLVVFSLPWVVELFLLRFVCLLVLLESLHSLFLNPRFLSSLARLSQSALLVGSSLDSRGDTLAQVLSHWLQTNICTAHAQAQN